MDKVFFKGFEKKAIKSIQSVLKMTSPIRKGMGPGMNIGQGVKGVASTGLKQIKV